jgi:hypothetical protein
MILRSGANTQEGKYLFIIFKYVLYIEINYSNKNLNPLTAKQDNKSSYSLKIPRGSRKSCFLTNSSKHKSDTFSCNFVYIFQSFILLQHFLISIIILKCINKYYRTPQGTIK